MRIGIAFDLVPADEQGDGPDDRYEEFDKPETIEAIAEVLRGEGHEVVLLGDGRDLLRRLLDDPPDFVWNLAEGQGTGRCREARVPALLEMLGIPYSGSDALTLSVALDKDIAKRLVQHDGLVRVPPGISIPPDADRHAVRSRLSAAFGDPAEDPLILKPALEGSSKGIRANCIAHTMADAVALFEELARDYGQPILVEQFIEGDEVTVGMIGNGRELTPLGAMRILPKERTTRFIYSLDVKRDWARRVDYESPAQLPDSVMERLLASARAAYEALGCRDLARIDFRLRDGTPYFLEANPLPGLSPVTSDLMLLARGYGVGHADLIRRILGVSLARVGLAQAEPVAP